MRLIDADALLNECGERQKSRPGDDWGGWSDHFLNNAHELSTAWWCVEKMIKDAPTVEQKRGQWIKRDAWMPGSEMETKYFPFQDCSVCGWSYRIKILSEFKFCPHCGAKMEEETT